MADEAKQYDYFGTFLESVKGSSRASQVQSGASPLKLLSVLDERGPQPVFALQNQANMTFSDFSHALDAAREAGLVELSGPSGQEIVSLTDAGRKLVGAGGP